MEIKVEVPTDIRERIAETIMQSAIGDAIQKGVEDVAKEVLGKSWNNPIRSAVEGIAKDLIKEMLSTPENIAQIRQAVFTELTTNRELLSAIIREAFSKARD